MRNMKGALVFAILFPMGNLLQAGYSLGIGFDFGKLLGRSLFLEVAYAADFRYFYDYGYAKLWSSSWSCRIGTTL